MLKYVAAYLRLRTTLKTNADFTEYAKYCEKLLQVNEKKKKWEALWRNPTLKQRTVYNSPRNLVPSLGELGAIKNKTKLNITVTCLDGFAFVVEIDPATIVLEVLNQTAKFVGLESTNGFALYEMANELER